MDYRITTIYDAIDRIGETVVVRRASTADVTTKAVVRGYGPDELVGGIQQGDKKVIISEVGLTTALKVQDKIVIDGRATTIQAVEKRKINDDVAMYVLQVRG